MKRNLESKFFTLLSFSLIILVTFFTSCEKEPEETYPNSNCTLSDITDEVLFNWDEYGPGYSSDTLFLVNNNSELQAIFGQEANFDFTNQSLLICSGAVNYTIGDIKATLNTLSSNNHTLNVKILLGGGCAITNWIKVFSTSSIINSDAEVTLDVEVFDNYDEYYNN